MDTQVGTPCVSRFLIPPCPPHVQCAVPHDRGFTVHRSLQPNPHAPQVPPTITQATCVGYVVGLQELTGFMKHHTQLTHDEPPYRHSRDQKKPTKKTRGLLPTHTSWHSPMINDSLYAIIPHDGLDIDLLSTLEGAHLPKLALVTAIVTQVYCEVFKATGCRHIIKDLMLMGNQSDVSIC